MFLCAPRRRFRSSCCPITRSYFNEYVESVADAPTTTPPPQPLLLLLLLLLLLVLLLVVLLPPTTKTRLRQTIHRPLSRSKRERGEEEQQTTWRRAGLAGAS